MKTQWIDIGSDVNWQEYGGLWACQVDEHRWHVVRFENTSEWGDDPGYRYHCDLREVDTRSPDMKQALDCIGAEPNASALERVYALQAYGAAAPLWQDGGNRARELIRAAHRESRLLRSDPQEYERRMDRPVNAIGSTAREYQAGDIHSAVLRAVAEGRPEGDLLLKMGC
jgi:hypothetical protein